MTMKKGVDDNWMFSCSVDEIKQRLDIMRDLGVEFLRLGIYWGFIEKTKGEFTFESETAHYDTIVNEAAARGIKILGLIGGEPNFTDYPEFAKKCYRYVNGVKSYITTIACPNGWNIGQTLCWQNFIYKAVSRYKDSIHHWEIWNEPNLNEFWHADEDLGNTSSKGADLKRNAMGFARLLVNTSRVIKANQPDGIVISGGINRVRCKYEHYPFHWLCTSRGYIDYFFEAIGKLKAWNSFDYFGIHPYRTSDGPQPGPKEENSKYSKYCPYIGTLEKEMRTLKNTYLKEKNIWITEIGWSESENQAKNLTETYEVCKALPCVDSVIWFNFKDCYYCTMGLVKSTFEVKDSALAFRDVNRRGYA